MIFLLEINKIKINSYKLILAFFITRSDMVYGKKILPKISIERLIIYIIIYTRSAINTLCTFARELNVTRSTFRFCFRLFSYLTGVRRARATVERRHRHDPHSNKQVIYPYSLSIKLALFSIFFIPIESFRETF